jgi:dihydroxy-acid dehydratase
VASTTPVALNANGATQISISAGMAGGVFFGSAAVFHNGAKGAITGYCSPEAGLGGPICAVRDGDIVTYDVEARTISVELTDEQIADRIKSFDKEVVFHDGFIGMYQKSVTSLRTGAVLRPTGPRK